MDDNQELSQEQIRRLTELAEEAEQELALGVQTQSNRAFNLGCTLWVIPGVVIVVAAFLLSKGNWVIASLLAVLVGICAVGFAIVSAYNTKKKATGRLYREITLPNLNKALADRDLSLHAFTRIALKTLPSNALLYQMLSIPDPEEENVSDTSDRNQTS